MTTSFLLPKFPFAGWRVTSISLVMLIGPHAQAATIVVPPGGSQTITNADPIDEWVLSPGSTLTSNGADTLEISAENATLIANGGSTRQIIGQLNSALNLTGVAVDNSTGARAAVRLSNSTADIAGSQLTSNTVGLEVARVAATQTGSRATLTDGSTVVALDGGALVTGFSQLNLINSSIQATGATSYGARLSNAGLNMTDSTISGGLNGLQIGTESALANATTVVLNNSSIESSTGSAIIVGFQDRPGITAEIDINNGSRLISGNNTLMEVNDGASANLRVDASALTGNVVVESGSTAAVSLKNSSTFLGNLQNVAQVSLDSSSMTGDVIAEPGSAASVQLNNNAVLEGRIIDTSTVAIDNGAQWVMTADSNVQRLALNGGVVQMGTNEQFQQLNVGDLSGNGTFVMGTDLGNGNTDFLNVTGNASGQHQLQISATGTNPVTAEAVKVGNIASGDASFSLGNRETVDAGTFVYRLAKEGQGLYLNPDKETVSTSTNTALALAGSARSVLNAEAAMLSDQLGDRSLSVRPEAAMRSMDDSSVKLSNSVWVRTYGNQYNVDNAYGDGYTQNQTGITGGADTTVDLGGRSWVVGGFVGTSHTKMDLKYGSSATVDSVNAGVYGSTFDVESGVFVNVMAKINQFDNKAKVTMSDGTRAKGDYKALGASGSVAIGKHIRLKDDYFVEPQVQVSTGVIQSDKYRLDNGLEVKSDTMRSLQGKVGVRGGRVIILDNGSLLEPSLMTAVNHEFVKNNEVKINDDSFDDDRASSSIEYGAGLKWTPAQRNWQVSGQVGGSKGTTVSQDWSGSVRVSYFF